MIRVSGLQWCSSRTAKTSRNCQPPKFTSCGGHLSFPCEEDTVFEEAHGKYVWNMTGDFIYGHHEVHRSLLYVPYETTLPSPMKYVHVMRQTKTSIDNASEHTPNDSWIAESEVLLSEEWTDTKRFQILRIKLPEGYTWVNDPPTTVHTTTPPDTIWSEE